MAGGIIWKCDLFTVLFGSLAETSDTLQNIIILLGKIHY